MASLFDTEIILQTKDVLVRPIIYNDISGFSEIAFDERIWKFSVNRINSKEELENFVQKALSSRLDRTRYAFTIIDRETGRIAGSTSIGNVSEYDSRAEIGWTWLGTEFQGKRLNKGTKYLLLNYLFSVLNYKRVEFKTDALNLQSNRALQRIGALEEGVLRSHTLMHDGRRRDTVYYGILDSEWDEIKRKIFSGYQKE
ncbi:MAG: GNAT family N-acetyltransferase [Syntrophothermus sp.]